MTTTTRKHATNARASKTLSKGAPRVDGAQSEPDGEKTQALENKKGTAAIYVRVSRLDQHPENQIAELRRHVATRGWDAVEFVERGVSGARDNRPRFDAMMAAVRRREFGAVVAWKLDRVGRSMRHLVTMLDELRALGVGFVTIGEGIDTTTPAGRLVFGIFAAVAEFERERLRERTLLGLDRARREGTALGRPRISVDLGAVEGLSLRRAAAALEVSVSTVRNWRREKFLQPADAIQVVAPK